MKKLSGIFVFILLISLIVLVNLKSSGFKKHVDSSSSVKLYWFIPDGMRAEPDLFNIYQWAKEGKLPNIKRVMDQGSYGFSVPVFPSHTPVNFATLLTGTWPETHGVADGPMRVEGRPLDKVAVGGFRSVARKIPAIWSTLEDQNKKVVILSTPGSTPPEIDQGVVIRGRWGGWGADFHAINFQSVDDGNLRREQGRGSRLFFFGPQLTQYLKPQTPLGWRLEEKTYSPAKEIKMVAWGQTIYGLLIDSTDDQKVNYDHIQFSFDKINLLARLSQSEWSDWSPIELSWNDQTMTSHVKFNVIKLDEDGFFRVRLVFNNLNSSITQPSEVAGELTEGIGPMVDFVDNFPPQLIYYPEDKTTFLAEMNDSFSWHSAAPSFLLKNYHPDVVIHDIYSPNQMLTSRWWMGYLDPASQRYGDKDQKERDQLWDEVHHMYQRLDEIVGNILNSVDKNTLVVISSDHGAVPLNKWVRLNNLLAKNGLLKFKIDSKSGEPIIDWKNSQAIYLKMDNIFIHPNGLDGNWTRGSGPEYEALRERIIKILNDLVDENGNNPIAKVVRWENAREFLDLPEDRVGDLIIANKAGYGWNEEMTENLEVFSTPLKTGYKQAILPDNEKGMWTPFMMIGPGVKKGHVLTKPIRHVDQYPTIMKLLGQDIPDIVEGEVIDEVLSR